MAKQKVIKNNKFKNAFKIAAAALCAAAIVAIVIITGRQNADKAEKTLNTTVMGTTASITVYGRNGSDIIDDIMDLENNLDEKVISWRSDGSEVWNINHSYKAGEDYQISDELADVLERTLEISEEDRKSVV